MNSEDLAHKIIALSNSRAPNHNFELKGWDPAKAALIIRAAIDVLTEEGLLTGCLLCKNSTTEKETS